MNIFTPEGADQSLNYLSMIFGAVGSILPASDNPTMLLAWIFKVVNSSVLTLGTLLVVYVTVVGVLATAHEGEFMGKKWSGLWVPIRMVMGIVAMFPVSSGYSSLQIVVMWIVVQGVGAADQVWTQALQYQNTFGSPFSSVVNTSSSDLAVQNQFPTLFQSIVCQAGMYATYSNTYGKDNDKYFYNCSPSGPNKSSPFCPPAQSSVGSMLNVTTGPQVTKPDPANDPMTVEPTKSGTQQDAQGNSHDVYYCPADYNAVYDTDQYRPKCFKDATITYNMGPGGVCGKLQYPSCKATCDNTKGGNPTSLECMACQAQPAALQSIVSAMGNIATKFTEVDHDYLTWTNTTPTASGAQLNPAPPSWIVNYCAANGISDPTECCNVKNVPPQMITLPNGQQLPVPGSSKKACAGQSLFTQKAQPYSSGGAGGALNNFETSEAAVTQAYDPYVLADFVGGIDFINAMKNNWLNLVIVIPTTTWLSNQAPKTLSDWMLKAQRSGWILAGGYYYNMVQDTKTATLISPPTTKFTTQGPTDISASVLQYRINYNAAKTFADDIKTGGQSGGQYGEVQALYGDVSGAMLRGLKNALTDDGSNPLVKIATFGQTLMITAQIIWGLLAVLIPVLVGVMTANFIVLGTGMPVTPWGEAIKAFFSFIGPYIFLLLASMFSVGALLGIYVPAIPYIIFTASAIGWFIGVIEAMVAAPFVALGILSPAGQHEILGRSEPAVMMMFNIFLRPTLMIVGLLAGMLLATVGVKFLNAGFMSVVANVMHMGGGSSGSQNNIGPFEQIIWIMLYGSLLMTILNKCFSLIHYLPEKVLTWIGGQAVSYGEGEMAGEAKRGVEAGAGAMGGAAKGGAEAGVKQAEGAPEKASAAADAKEQRDARAEEKNKKGPTGRV